MTDMQQQRAPSYDDSPPRRTHGFDAPHADVLALLGIGDDGSIPAEATDTAHDDPPHAPAPEDDGDRDGNRDDMTQDAALERRVESIAFEALLHGVKDARVSSLLRILGWPDAFSCFVVAGTPTTSFGTARRDIRTRIRNLGGRLSVIGHHDRRCAVLAAIHGAATPEVTCTALLDIFDKDEPVCLAPIRHDVAGASHALRAAFSALKAAPAVHPLPRPMRADDVLPERALLGDDDARGELYTSVYKSLLAGGDDDPTLITISTFIHAGGSLDLTARTLNVHPNTVRYRLKRAAETTGWDATDPREAFVLQTAIAVGRVRDAEHADA